MQTPGPPEPGQAPGEGLCFSLPPERPQRLQRSSRAPLPPPGRWSWFPAPRGIRLPRAPGHFRPLAPAASRPRGDLGFRVPGLLPPRRGTSRPRAPGPARPSGVSSPACTRAFPRPHRASHREPSPRGSARGANWPARSSCARAEASALPGAARHRPRGPLGRQIPPPRPLHSACEARLPGAAVPEPPTSRRGLDGWCRGQRHKVGPAARVGRGTPSRLGRV